MADNDKPGAATSGARTNTAPDAAARWLAALPPVPPLVVPRDHADWEQARARLRAQLQQVLGDLPPRPAMPDVRIRSREERHGYRLERFEFDNGAGATVPGCLLLPATAQGPVPAIVYCHWHGGQYDVGKEELFGTNATPVPAGPALARAGYAVIAVDAYCFGERNGAGPGGTQEKGSAGELTASKFQLWAGRSLWGMIVRDDLMTLDYLCRRPEVDTNRIGITGISMGATRTWWAMALDDRLQAGVAVCCLTRYQDLIRAGGLRYHGIYYYVPGLLRQFDTEAVVALSAPRPLLFQSGETDAGSPVSGIRAIEDAVRPIYQLHEREANFRSRVYPGVGHVYLPEMWEETLRWLGKHLMR